VGAADSLPPPREVRGRRRRPRPPPLPGGTSAPATPPAPAVATEKGRGAARSAAGPTLAGTSTEHRPARFEAPSRAAVLPFPSPYDRDYTERVRRTRSMA